MMQIQITLKVLRTSGRQELKEILSDDELSELSGVYEISEGNFEGKNHLIRKNDTPLTSIESKLLSSRNSRKTTIHGW